MTTVDLVFLVLIFVAQPIYGRWAWRRMIRAIEAGAPVKRRRLYGFTMLEHGVALLVLLGAWWWLGRPADWLGARGDTDPGFWLTAALGGGVLAVLAVMTVRMRSLAADERQGLRNKLGDLVHLAPRTRRELNAFFALSLSAGIVEELIFRGYLIWALSQVIPTWLAVLFSSLGFGLAHSYQGIAGIARTGAVGFTLAVVYLGSGSIWLPMLFHFLFDVIQGVQLRALLWEPRENKRAGVPSGPTESA